MDDNPAPTRRKREQLDAQRAAQNPLPAPMEAFPETSPRMELPPRLSPAKEAAVLLLIQLTDGQIPEADIPRVKAQIEAAGLPVLPVETLPDGSRAIVLHRILRTPYQQEPD